MADDRAVSETLGFVLTFALVVTAVGLVSTAGLGTLTELRDTEQLNSADRGMQHLDSTFDDLDRGDPRRSAQLSLNGGRLSLNRTNLSVAVWDHGSRSGTPIATVNESVMALEHTVEGEQVVYEAGAVLRSDAGTIRRQPSITCRDSRAIVSLIAVTNDSDDVAKGRGDDQTRRIDVRDLPTDDAIAEGDEGRIEVTGIRNRTRLPYVEPQAESPTTRDVVVNVSATSNPSQWDRYFDRRPDWQRDSDHVFHCAADSVHVRVTEIELTVS